jgi:hypothetical protein
MLRVVLGNPDPDLAHTAAGRGVLLRLQTGQRRFMLPMTATRTTIPSGIPMAPGPCIGGITWTKTTTTRSTMTPHQPSHYPNPLTGSCRIGTRVTSQCIGECGRLYPPLTRHGPKPGWSQPI